MPDSKEISALTTAEQISSSDLIETAIPNAMTETGYISRKHSLGSIADFFLKTLQFLNLNTTAKTICGAINELAQGSGQSLDALNDVDIDDQTLTDGQGIVYDATEQKWKNGSVSSGHTYSTTEQVVGTWTDGSTIYEKTIPFQALPSTAGTFDYPLGLTGYNKIISYDLIVSDGTTFISLPFYSSDSTYVMSAYLTTINNELNVEGLVGRDRSAFNDNKVIVRYTKSSTPSS